MTRVMTAVLIECARATKSERLSSFESKNLDGINLLVVPLKTAAWQ